MSYNVKNIEQENINVKKAIYVAIAFTIGTIGVLVALYYYFTFEKNAIMYEQYLGVKSKIGESYNIKEKEKIQSLDMESAYQKIIKDYDN